MTFGALQPKTDVRDYKIKACSSLQLPKEFICENLPEVKDQKSVCSCVAHALSSILEYFNIKENNTNVKLSTDFIYGMQGIAFGRKDSGMYLRDACKIALQYGDPSANTIKGNTEQPKCTENLEAQLNDEIYEEALNYRVQSYAKCTDEIKQALVKNGPVLASIKWYHKNSFDDKVIIMDKTSDYGFHAVMVYGYNEKGWLCQNSWGKNWNDDGRFIYPYSEEFREAWSFVDADSEDVVKPARSSILDIIYKIINFIINLVKRGN